MNPNLGSGSLSISQRGQRGLRFAVVVQIVLLPAAAADCMFRSLINENRPCVPAATYCQKIDTPVKLPTNPCTDVALARTPVAPENDCATPPGWCYLGATGLPVPNCSKSLPSLRRLKYLLARGSPTINLPF